MKRLHLHLAVGDLDRSTGEATVYGESPALDALSGERDGDGCCTPATPQGICCAPKPQLSAGAPCCGPA